MTDLMPTIGMTQRLSAALDTALPRYYLWSLGFHLTGNEDMDGIIAKIDETVKGNRIVLFMKGTPEAPQCGFSAQVVQILSFLGAEYHSVDVLADPEVRQGIKEYASWPTIPQLYVGGEFVGGCDIVREMFQEGELKALLAA